MDIIKPIIDFGQLLPINILLKPNITQSYFDTTIVPAIRKITEHNKIPLRVVKHTMVVIHDEILIKFDPPTFRILCSHEFYDGKVISNLCMQLNHYMEHNELLEPITKKKVVRSITSSLVRCVGTKLINQGLLGEKHIQLLKTFKDPIKASFIVKYIQNLEQKNIIYFRGNKDKHTKQGNNFNIYKIYNDQSLKEALSKNQIISKMDIPQLILNQNYVIVNLYPHFTIPYFGEKMIFDQTNTGVLLLDKIVSVIAIKSYVLMPKSASNTYDLYEVIQ